MMLRGLCILIACIPCCMILCEMPEKKVEARKKYFARKNADQNQFVESNLNKVERSGGVSIDRDFRSDVSRGQKIVDD